MTPRLATDDRTLGSLGEAAAQDAVWQAEAAVALRYAGLCADCETIYDLRRRYCPCCASRTRLDLLTLVQGRATVLATPPK